MIDLRLAKVDLSQLVTGVAERLRPQFVDQAVDLVLDRSQTSTVTVDRDRLAHVLTNLIGNALTYTPTGGRVTIQTLQHAGMAQVEVTDTGRGMTTDQLAMAFERFYRVDRAAVGGTGIGLTIARSLARLHGGEITASPPGPAEV